MAFTTTITVIGGDLFHIALEQLGDATQATRIAQLNDIDDWFLIDGVQYTLEIPPANPAATGGVPQT